MNKISSSFLFKWIYIKLIGDLCIKKLEGTSKSDVNFKMCVIFRELEAASLSACRIHGTTPPPTFSANLAEDLGTELGPGILEDALCRGGHSWHHCPEVHKAIDGVRFIADHTKREEDSTRVSLIYLPNKTF